MNLVYRTVEEVGVRLDGVRVHIRERFKVYEWWVVVDCDPGQMNIASGECSTARACRKQIDKVLKVYDEVKLQRRSKHATARATFEKLSPGVRHSKAWRT